MLPNKNNNFLLRNEVNDINSFLKNNFFNKK